MLHVSNPSHIRFASQVSAAMFERTNCMSSPINVCQGLGYRLSEYEPVDLMKPLGITNM